MRRRIAVTECGRNDATVVLTAALPPSGDQSILYYEAPTGALARIDGRVAGAFDREHRELLLEPAAVERRLTLEVERRSLPTNGLPPGPGLRWTLLQRGAATPPGYAVIVEDAKTEDAAVKPSGVDGASPLTLWGHGHLDVAWLWTYDEARRKAARTFANAIALLERDPAYVFVQSQPQLYDFVRGEDEELFARVIAYVREGRFDAGVAAMWVEPDCNVPSGESLLRQMLVAHDYCTRNFGIEPSIAWLPDTFGFARTLPTLLAHAGIAYFGTTKLQWNDTTQFPFAQFRWRGPDGAEVIAASIDRMEGGFAPGRVAIARKRGEPLVAGYGDGGGGPTIELIREAPLVGTWEPARAWFDRVAARHSSLPVHDDELYLQYHRGTYTTHHDVKAANAALERGLSHAEEQAAWCVAVRAPAEALGRVRASLGAAWEIVLRNQFHDVLPGTSIAPVYRDAAQEYARAAELVEAAIVTTRAMLPRSGRLPSPPAFCEPTEDDGAFVFENAFVRARVLRTGAIVELLSAPAGRNVVAQANLLAYYRDHPKKWEAWNVDAGYERSRKAAKPQPPRIVDGGLETPFDIAGSPATMRVSLGDADPFVRVELAVGWRARGRLLRVENWLALETADVIYGAPHGVVKRSALDDTPERRAQFEVPGQRFAYAADDRGDGLAMLSLDTYGWNARTLKGGGVRLGHSLLRSTSWPDPSADVGEQRLSWAYAPATCWSIGTVERLWERFAAEARVRLFESSGEGVLVAAAKPAHDGQGVILRIRECNGVNGTFRLRCGARMREVTPVDALERVLPGAPAVRIEEESLLGEIGAYALRSFRVSFA